MKLFVRASVLSLAVAGLVAGFAPGHPSATVQAATLSHQIINAGMPNPTCGPSTCQIRQ